MTRRLLCLFLIALTGTLALAQSPQLVPKQLAGPPSEFTSMQPQPLVADGIRSKSALLPVQFKAVDDRWVWKSAISIENPESFQMVVFSGHETWDLRLRAPGMKTSVAIEELYLEARDDFYGIEENLLPCRFYHFESGNTGQWQLEITTDQDLTQKAQVGPDGFVMVASENPYRLYAHQTSRRTLIGETLGLAAFAFDKRAFGAEDQPQPGSSQIVTASMKLTTPSGTVTVLPMTDAGLANDGLAQDGVFGAQFVPEELGTYHAQITAKSISADGIYFTRTTEHVIPVVFPEIDLAAREAITTLQQDDRLKITIPLDSFAANTNKYRVFAEVWGSNSDDELVPVAWVGGMSALEHQNINLALDSRWIGISGAQAPFVLKNLRIEDPTYFIPLIAAGELDLHVDKLPGNAFLETKMISEEMRMGPKPDMPAYKGSGSRLLLVHGYCSGNAWGGVANQFSQASVFQDFNQNRSHDQFAQLINSYGQTWNSYGIVAHSQGGAAALHLYTYYWSGLDNASGSRLIQSVGTPYQGTALAGNLAAIGAVFGAGCGTNNNLTYSGASAWLSGIPSWARSKVNYYTTAFKDRWWAYDYCHIATDLFLDDPDDGTTERSKGQLSGGINRGHKSGWCHTSGMRDPAQTTDSSRNGTMNANAAR